MAQACTMLLAAAALASTARAAPTANDDPPGNHLFSNPLADQLAAPSGADGRPPVLQGLDVHEHLGAQLPLALSFSDSGGRPFQLSQALHAGRPLVLTLVYFDCPMLCSLVLDGLVRGLNQIRGWQVGRDYDALTVSFNPADNAARGAEKRRGFLQALGGSELGSDWPFLVGDAADTTALAQAVGFDYRYDAQSKSFAHNAVVTVVTPTGTISRYLYGVTFDPFQLRLALTEAGQGKSGSSFERFLLSCYHYDPASRRYGLFLSNYFKLGGVLILLAVAGLVGSLLWRDTRRLAPQPGAPTTLPAPAATSPTRPT